MKILHVIPSMAPARGGPSVLLRMLACGLADSGVEVHVATTDDNGKEVVNRRYGVPISDGGVTYWFFKRQTRLYTVSSGLNRWLAAHMTDYDLLHIHALFSFPSVSAAYWAGRRRVPYIVRPLGTLNRWGVQNRRPWLKKMSLHCVERRILARATAIHYTSEQERLEAMNFAAGSRAEIIPNAVERCSDTPVSGVFRERHPELKGRQIVLFLSRFDAKKGLDLLIPAFAEVQRQKPEAILVLAGTGDPESVVRIKDECGRLGLGPHVLHVGFLEGSNKHAAFQDADVFVLPSYSENFGIAAAEAMAAGVPIVISDQVAIHHEVTDARAGLVVTCNANSLAEALLRLLRDAPLRAELGQNGKELVQRRYSLKAVSQRVLSLYQEISSQR